jgi:catechol 2,3-dioxygenase-like lactoylglutathione lyase family enzyme
MNTNTTITDTTAFHLSLHVADLPRAVAFYRRLLDTEPGKQHQRFARFTPAHPPLVLSLVEQPATTPSGPQRLSHLGFRVDSAAALAAARQRLTAAGLELREEPESRCCYAVQDKFWVLDPDGNEWEFYRLLADLDEPGEDSKGCC